MSDLILEPIIVTFFVISHFVNQFDLLLVCTSLVIFVFMQRTPPFVLIGHKPPVVVDTSRPLHSEITKYKKLAAVRWFLALLLVCLPLVGTDAHRDITAMIMSTALIAYGYRVGFLMRLDGMTELGFLVKKDSLEVHLQQAEMTFRKKTYSELVRLMTFCNSNEIRTITMSSPMFYKRGTLREMSRITTLAESKGWTMQSKQIKIDSLPLVFAALVLFTNSTIRRKVNPFVWHSITLRN